MTDACAAVILAAGAGTRMRSETPKVLHQVGGKSMLAWSADLARALGADPIVVVVGAQGPGVAEAAQGLGLATAVQDPPLGTGHAVAAAGAALTCFEGRLIVLYADTPAVRPDTARRALAALEDAAVAVLGFETDAPGAYGRLIRDPEGGLARIVEAKDAGPEELAVTLCNSGVMAARAPLVWSLLDAVGNDNAKGEYYLTDIVGLARARGDAAAAVVGEEAEFLGANDRAGLAAAEAAFQSRARADAMAAGVSLIAPETVMFAHDTRVAADATIEPYVVFGPGVTVEAGAVIRAFTHVEGAVVRAGAVVGPYARVRPGSDIGPDARIGNFVELKNASLAAGVKAGHLSYLGDVRIGARANIGAGSITCNYDGTAKHRTVIGEDAFIGSDTALVAPVSVGAGAYTGSGSVITRDVPDGALSVARGRQRDIRGWTERRREPGGES